MSNYFIYNQKQIHYKIVRKNVKRINLRITPDLEVIVSANSKINQKFISEFINEKARWIYKQLEKFEKTQPFKTQNQFISGETVRYLGKQYLLKVFEFNKNIVRFYRGKIELRVKDKNDFDLKKYIYNDWLEMRANVVFREILEEAFENFKGYNLPFPKMKIRKMKSRWGSCNSQKNRININSNLIKAPKLCIKYVILHELTHLIYSNHSPKFYSLLSVVMPNWVKYKTILDEKIIKEL